MTPIERTLIISFLEDLSERQGDDGCNDHVLIDTPENREFILSAYNGEIELWLSPGKIHATNFVLVEELLHRLKAGTL